ncbi:MAG: DUF438 domain-containing protein [Spirochaetia bacterium]|jgi:DUF438 domain-containing protein|nr:DUF438 domain-containing protein [Spirochaetales bacterium]MDX9784746.1 DUF438 domain-containing protein [Spirochaetia bacterium]
MNDKTIIDPARQVELKKIIARLHDGEPASELKKEFAALIKGVSAAEVAAMEQSLIDGGMPVEEVQRLCEVHVQVFQQSLSLGKKPKELPGHPIYTMIEENKQARKKASALVAAARSWAWGIGAAGPVASALEDLAQIIVHYTRKENQLFPYLERDNFTGPSRVMWGKHDEIRARFGEARKALKESPKAFLKIAKPLASSIKKMIFMEERILIPESARRLSEKDWAEIRLGEDAIGFAWVKPDSLYDAGLVLASQMAMKDPGSLKKANPKAEAFEPSTAASAAEAEELLELATGRISREVLDLALKTLPVDISVVDENDRVLYYSDAPHRIFPRSPAVIGRSVQNCHPQKSVDVVNKILVAFKNKEKSKARFWIEMGGRFILIEYYALYDEKGTYRGTLEVSQDLTELRALEGQRRLLDWE